MKKRSCLQWTVALAAIWPACAQAAAEDGATTQQASDTTQAAPVANKNGSALGEIVVTAQRRSENLQDVPLAVAALSSSQLVRSGVTNIQDLGHVVPTLGVSNAVGFAITTLRGVGSTAIGPGIEPPVSIYLDGVYYASTASSLFDLTNIDRVEVLKGPQGTLFGRNATGGLIQVFTRDPGQNFEASGHLTYGNYQTLKGDLYASGPATDNLAGDFSLQASGMGKGYGRNLANGDDVNKNDHTVSIRSKWVWKLGPDTKITAIGDYTTQENSFNTGRLPKGNLSALPGAEPYGGSAWDTDTDLTPHFSNRNYGASLKIDQSTDFAEFSNIFAYRRSFTENKFDVDFTPIPYLNADLIARERQISEEFRIASPSSSKLKWQIGAYYFNARGMYDPSGVDFAQATINPALNPIAPFEFFDTYGNQLTQSIAGYGQATYEILPSTNLTAGVRYTHEKRSLIGRLDAALPGPTPFETIATYNPAPLTFNKPTFRASLDHRFSPEVLVYVSFNTGFKSGGFNTQNPGDPSFKPETLNAYEAGIKTDLFDRRVRFNLDGYYYDYKNIQVQKVGLADTGIINGASARIWGIEGDLDAVVTSRLRINASAAYTHARFRDFKDAPTGTPAGGVAVTPGDASGNDIPKAPHFQGVVSADYKFDLPQGTINIDGFYSYNSGYYLEADNVFHQPHFSLVNASVTWTSPNKKYSIKGWANNITKKAVVGYLSTLADGTRNAYYEAPRTYGVTLGFNM